MQYAAGQHMCGLPYLRAAVLCPTKPAAPSSELSPCLPACLPACSKPQFTGFECSIFTCLQNCNWAGTCVETGGCQGRSGKESSRRLVPGCTLGPHSPSTGYHAPRSLLCFSPRRLQLLPRLQRRCLRDRLQVQRPRRVQSGQHMRMRCRSAHVLGCWAGLLLASACRALRARSAAACAQSVAPQPALISMLPHLPACPLLPCPALQAGSGQPLAANGTATPHRRCVHRPWGVRLPRLPVGRLLQRGVRVLRRWDTEGPN